MTTIKVREPKSRRVRLLHIQPIKNFYYPGWVVFMPEHKNILLYCQNGYWRTIPEAISDTYAQVIGKKISSLKVCKLS